MRKILTATLAAGALTAVGAQAATTSTSFNVTATVQATCVAKANALNFGTYTPGGGDLKVNTSISVACTKGAIPTVSLDKGANGATVAARAMKDPVSGNLLAYNLYQDAAFTTLFGDGSNGSSTDKLAASTGFNTAQNVTVYGWLQDSAANQAVAPGTGYTDTVNVTVTY
ncbi:MAG: spore coat protein U domain-containing protein [Gammaproteobacteria bacterium]|nr:spore coat protein U domain-containing protein [Gammaproteobacteria bacterium]